MSDRFLLFGLESFNELLNQTLPQSMNWESSLEKIKNMGLDAQKLQDILGMVSSILIDPMTSLDEDLQLHMKRQMKYAYNKKIIIKSDILGEFAIEILKEKPKFKITKPTYDEINKLPVIVINKDALILILERKATMLEMLLKKTITISNTVELGEGFTRILLSLPSLYLTNEQLLAKTRQGFEKFFSQFN
ncbi:MAG: hypothetical protein ACTSVY_14470 [Candidatus Helarchaeota archaeon]